jgi:hypothetical protein
MKVTYYEIWKLVKSEILPAGQYLAFKIEGKKFNSLIDAEDFISKEFISKPSNEREELGHYWFPKAVSNDM